MLVYPAYSTALDAVSVCVVPPGPADCTWVCVGSLNESPHKIRDWKLKKINNLIRFIILSCGTAKVAKNCQIIIHTKRKHRLTLLRFIVFFQLVCFSCGRNIR